MDELQAKLKELDETHISDLKLIQEQHDQTGKKAKESGDKQLEAANTVIPGWKEVSKTIDELIKDYDRLSGTAGLVSSTLSEAGTASTFSKPTEAIDLITAAMDKLRDKSGLLTTDIDEGLKPAFENLTDSQLDKLLGEVNKQMDAGQLSVENYSLRTALANEQQTRLGTSTVALANNAKALANTSQDSGRNGEDSRGLWH